MAPMNSRVLELMAAAHQSNLSRIQIAAEWAAEDAWLSLDSFDDEAEGEWNTLFWIISGAAVAAAAAATWSYMNTMNRYVGVAASLPNPTTAWFTKDFADWGRSPILRARALSGEFGERAVRETSPYVSKLVTAATRQAEQQTFADLIESIEWTTTFEYTEETPSSPITDVTLGNIDEVRRQAHADGYPTTRRDGSALRWRRMTQAGACGFCRVLADRTYSDKAHTNNPTGAYHTFCRCTWRRITPNESRLWKSRYDDGRWEEIIDERFDDSTTTTT